MPRLFDILKEKAGAEKEEKNKQEVIVEKESGGIKFPSQTLNNQPPPEKSLEGLSLVSKKLISAVKTHGVDNEDEAKELYLFSLEIIKSLVDKAQAQEDINPVMKKIDILLDEIYSQLVLGDSILENIYEKEGREYSLAAHILNVLVLSLSIGLKTGFNKSRLDILGMAAVFSDLGFDDFQEVVKNRGRYKDGERRWAQAHITKSLKIAEKVKGINEIVKETIQAHHERVNGKGQPSGMRAGDINSYAKIIGLIDTYEMLVNMPSSMEEMNAHKAAKFIVGYLKEYFDSEVMRAFLDKMSLYPIGSIVRLDTGELARVISVQPGSPLRPVVMVIAGASGEPAKERNIIDLSKQDFPAIQESL